MIPPYNSKKKKGKDRVGTSKTLVQEKTPSPITQNKGRTKANMDSSVKKPLVTLEKNKEKEKVSEPSKEPSIHVYLHYSM
jgi:hypothetical protein